MVPASYHRSRPDGWTEPRWATDPGERRRIYGPIRPMEQKQGLLDWLFGRTT